MEYDEVKSCLTDGCYHNRYYFDNSICKDCSQQIIIYVDRLQDIIDECLKSLGTYFTPPA